MAKRDYYFDNAKFLLIFLVVFGHAIQTYIQEEPFLLAVYKTIYAFHMPAFILVAGYFAKGIYEKGYTRKLLKKLIVPYLIFQLIYTIYYYFLRNQESLVLDPFNPQWSLWFLISMFFWNMLLLLVVHVFKLSWKTALPIAVLMGILIGFVNDFSSFLSLSRTFVFFPFFLLGYYAKREHLTYLKRRAIKLASFISLSFMFFIMVLLPEWSNSWLLGSASYADLGVSTEFSPFIRILIYVLNIWMVTAFLAIVPEKKYFFTNLGKNTLYVYLLHGFIIQYFRELEVTFIINPFVTFMMIMAASLLLTLLLSTNWITAVAQPLIELRANRMKKIIEKQKS